MTDKPKADKPKEDKPSVAKQFFADLFNLPNDDGLPSGSAFSALSVKDKECVTQQRRIDSLRRGDNVGFDSLAADTFGHWTANRQQAKMPPECKKVLKSHTFDW